MKIECMYAMKSKNLLIRFTLHLIPSWSIYNNICVLNNYICVFSGYLSGHLLWPHSWRSMLVMRRRFSVTMQLSGWFYGTVIGIRWPPVISRQHLDVRSASPRILFGFQTWTVNARMHKLKETVWRMRMLTWNGVGMEWKKSRSKSSTQPRVTDMINQQRKYHPEAEGVGQDSGARASRGISAYPKCPWWTR